MDGELSGQVPFGTSLHAYVRFYDFLVKDQVDMPEVVTTLDFYVDSVVKAWEYIARDAIDHKEDLFNVITFFEDIL